MTDMLWTLVTLCGLTVAGCLLVVLLGVLPFTQTVDVAERRGFSTFRWGAVAVAGILAMLVLAYVVLSKSWSVLLLLPAVSLAWVSLGVVSLIDSEDRSLGGTPGRHQP